MPRAGSTAPQDQGSIAPQPPPPSKKECSSTDSDRFCSLNSHYHSQRSLTFIPQIKCQRCLARGSVNCRELLLCRWQEKCWRRWGHHCGVLRLLPWPLFKATTSWVCWERALSKGRKVDSGIPEELTGWQRCPGRSWHNHVVHLVIFPTMPLLCAPGVLIWTLLQGELEVALEEATSLDMCQDRG